MSQRPPYALGTHRIAAGSRRTVDLPVSVLSDHTPVTMSAHVIHGRRDGPRVFVTAGIHGDEIIGVEIVRRLLSLPQLDALRGTLVAVPIVNTFGFLNRSRYLPDRRDLNRSFPGSPEGSLAARLAHLLLTEIVLPCDLGIDLHSAAVNRTNLPQIRVSAEDEEGLRLAGVFGAPVILASALRPGSLRAVAQDGEVPVLLYEAGEGLRFDELAVRAGVSGILRVLHDRGMVPARGIRKARRAPILCRASRWVRAPQGGLVRTFRARGDVVAEGDLLAVVSDPFGEIEAQVLAPAAGIVVGRAVLPLVNEGDALFHIAESGPSRTAETTLETLTTQLADDPLFDEDEII